MRPAHPQASWEFHSSDCCGFTGPIYVRGGAAIRDINGAVCISLLTNHGMSQMPRDSNFMQNGTRRHPSSHLAASEP